MASVCGGTLALLDAGVPLADSAAGVAVGLVKAGDKHAVLLDILGLEAYMFSRDSSAFLSFVFFRKLLECYKEEATFASYFCLFLLFCHCPPGATNLSSTC